MSEYQFSYDDGTMCVFALEDSQFRGVTKGIKEGKSHYIDDKNGLILKLSEIRSVKIIPENPIQEAESYEPTYDKETQQFLELQRYAEQIMREYDKEDDSDYKGGITL